MTQKINISKYLEETQAKIKVTQKCPQQLPKQKKTAAHSLNTKNYLNNYKKYQRPNVSAAFNKKQTKYQLAEPKNSSKLPEEVMPQHIKKFLEEQPAQISQNVRNMFKFMEMMSC